MNREALLTDLAEKLDCWPAASSMPGPECMGVWTNHGEWRCYAIGSNEPAITGKDWLRKVEELKWPIGSLCEIRINDHDWRIFTVVGHDDGGIIYRSPFSDDHAYKWATGGGIRKTRTPEQRAIDNAISHMLGELAPAPSNRASEREVCERIYAAIRDGKIPGVILGAPHE